MITITPIFPLHNPIYSCFHFIFHLLFHLILNIKEDTRSLDDGPTSM